MNYLNSVKLFKKAKLAFKYPLTSWNILTDGARKKLFGQTITSFPRIITLYVTNKCNLNCPMCLNAKYRNKNKSDKDINIKTIKKILPELIRYKPMVCITGGEPLLNQDVIKIISLLSKNRILTTMTTNGFLLEKYAQSIADSGLEFLTISLDHFDEKKHDKNRGVKQTYSKLISGLKKLNTVYSKTPSNIKINTVISKNNFNELSKMYDFIETLGVDEWSVQHYNFVNPTAQKNISTYFKTNYQGDYIEGNLIHTELYLNTKQVSILQKQLDEIKKKGLFYKTKLSTKPEINDIVPYYQGKFPSKKSQCNWPCMSINIMKGSKVTLCIGNEIGNLDDKTFIQQIWSSKQANDFQEKVLKEKVFPFCFRCCGLNFHFHQKRV